MLIELGPRGRRAWDLLERVADNSLPLAEVFDAYSRNDLDGLRARIDDVDLAVHVASWTAWLTDRVSAATRQRYFTHLRTLIPEGKSFQRSAFTAPAIARWLAQRTQLPRKRRKAVTGSRRKDDAPALPASASTKRRCLAAVQSFSAYLVEMGVLATSPVRDVHAPPANDPRCVFLELPDVQRLVEGAVPPYRALFALAYGAGIEVSAMLALVETDVDLARRQVRARGTNAWTRDRIARVADWAWPHVEKHLATITPGERLFRGISRWDAGDAHRERLTVLGLTGYRLHDSRHHWAVRMVRAGMPLELVARQLGHRDVVMAAKVYARFVPKHQERDRWELAASALDIEKWPELGTLAGTVPDTKSSQPLVSDWPVSSRGGTRTRDPGIMSAVL